MRVLACPAYLDRAGRPRSVAGLAGLAGHSCIGFTQPDSLNQWPLTSAAGERYEIAPSLHASSGETVRQRASRAWPTS